MMRLIPLGGLGEIGLNMMLVESGGSRIIVDVGLMFPEDYMLGVDYVIPDMSFLRPYKDGVHGIVLTHAHEDHIGALPFLLKHVDAPVFGTPFTLGMVRQKLEEFEVTAAGWPAHDLPRPAVVAGALCARFHPRGPQRGRRSRTCHRHPRGPDRAHGGFQDQPRCRRRDDHRHGSLRPLRRPRGARPAVRFDQRRARGLHGPGHADRRDALPDRGRKPRPHHRGAVCFQHRADSDDRRHRAGGRAEGDRQRPQHRDQCGDRPVPGLPEDPARTPM